MGDATDFLATHARCELFPGKASFTPCMLFYTDYAICQVKEIGSAMSDTRSSELPTGTSTWVGGVFGLTVSNFQIR